MMEVSETHTGAAAESTMARFSVTLLLRNTSVVNLSLDEDKRPVICQMCR